MKTGNAIQTGEWVENCESLDRSNPFIMKAKQISHTDIEKIRKEFYENFYDAFAGTGAEDWVDGNNRDEVWKLVDQSITKSIEAERENIFNLLHMELQSSGNMRGKWVLDSEDLRKLLENLSHK